MSDEPIDRAETLLDRFENDDLDALALVVSHDDGRERRFDTVLDATNTRTGTREQLELLGVYLQALAETFEVDVDEVARLGVSAARSLDDAGGVGMLDRGGDTPR